MFDFRLFPGTNFNRINLDWIFSKLKELQEGQSTVTEAAEEATAAAEEATAAATEATEAATSAVEAIETVTATAEAAEATAEAAEATANGAASAASSAQQTATNAGAAAAAAQQTADSAATAAAAAQQTANNAGTAAAAAQQTAASAQQAAATAQQTATTAQQTAATSVQYVAQTLTAEQKAQARENIGAAETGSAFNIVVRSVQKTNSSVNVDGVSQFYFATDEFNSSGTCLGIAGYVLNGSNSSKYVHLYRMIWNPSDPNSNNFWFGVRNIATSVQDLTVTCYAAFLE